MKPTARLVRILLAAGLCGGAVAVPAAQAADTGPLTVSGTGSSSMILDVTRNSTLRPSDLRMATKGTYAGIAVLDRTGRVLAMSLNVRRWIQAQPSVAVSPVTSAVGTLALKPGRYRLLLLTDGPSTVTVPATGDLARAVRPTGRYDDDVRITDITSALPLASSFASERVNIRKGGFLALALHSETYLNQLQYTALCIAQPDSPTCNPVGDFGGNLVRQSVGSSVKAGWTSLRYTTPNAPTGIFDARFEDAAADSGTRRDSLVVVI